MSVTRCTSATSFAAEGVNHVKILLPGKAMI